MKKAILTIFFSFTAGVAAMAQQPGTEAPKIISATAKIKIKAKNCDEIDWDKQSRAFAKLKSSGIREFAMEIEREGQSRKDGLPTTTTFSVKGRKPEKVVKRARKLCGQLLPTVPEE